MVRWRLISVIVVFAMILASASPALAQVTIRFVGWGSLQERNNVERVIEQFEAENPDIRVDWIHIPEDYFQMLQIMIAGGTPPDVFWLGTDIYRDFVYRGMVYDITERLAADPVLGAEDYFLQPQENDRIFVGDSAYGIGSCWVSMHLYYNKGLFDEAGLAYPPADPHNPWTWEEFRDTAARLTIDNQGRNALDAEFDKNNIVQWGLFFPTWWKPLMSVMWAHGGEVFNEDLTEFVLDDPKSLAGMENLAELFQMGIVPLSTVLEGVGMTAQQMLSTGRVAMHWDGSWALQDLALLDFELGTGVLPVAEGETPVTPIQAHIHSIYANTAYPDESWELLRFISSEIYQKELVRAGLWLPSQTALTGEEGIAKWWNDDVHPPEYGRVGTEYVEYYGRTILMPPGTNQAFSELGQALDPVWIGRADVVQVILDTLPLMNRALARATQRR